MSSTKKHLAAAGTGILAGTALKSAFSKEAGILTPKPTDGVFKSYVRDGNRGGIEGAIKGTKAGGLGGAVVGALANVKNGPNAKAKVLNILRGAGKGAALGGGSGLIVGNVAGGVHGSLSGIKRGLANNRRNKK